MNDQDKEQVNLQKKAIIEALREHQYQVAKASFLTKFVYPTIFFLVLIKGVFFFAITVPSWTEEFKSKTEQSTKSDSDSEKIKYLSQTKEKISSNR